MDFYRAELETLRLELEQVNKDRDAAEQKKNAEQLEQLKKNSKNHNDAMIMMMGQVGVNCLSNSKQ